MSYDLKTNFLQPRFCQSMENKLILFVVVNLQGLFDSKPFSPGRYQTGEILRLQFQNCQNIVSPLVSPYYTIRTALAFYLKNIAGWTENYNCQLIAIKILILLFQSTYIRSFLINFDPYILIPALQFSTNA